ncbi:MAG: hypothetical protein ACSLEW_12645 [Nocardioides sp.]
MTLALQIFAGILGSLALLVLVVWSGNASLKSGGPSATGTGNAFGSAAGIFDPGTARAMDEIKQWENTAAPLPLPDPDDLPMAIDLDSGVARIIKP